MELCKSTKHRYRTKKNKNCNTNKINEVNEFLDDYGKALQLFFSYLYNNPITYKKKIKEMECTEFKPEETYSSASSFAAGKNESLIQEAQKTLVYG